MGASRKGYVYRFLDENLKVLYVGKTVNMHYRMKEHFSKKSHLADSGLYEKVHKIEYITCPTEYDSLAKELYYINLYKPQYNTMSKIKQVIYPNKNDIWKTWKIVKPINKQIEQDNKNLSKFLPFVVMLFFILTLSLYF